MSIQKMKRIRLIGLRSEKEALLDELLRFGKKAGPSRGKLVLIVLFLAFLCTSVWILYKEDQLKPLLGLS